MRTYVKLDARSIFDIQKNRTFLWNAVPVFTQFCCRVAVRIFTRYEFVYILVMHPLKRLNVLNVLLNV